MSILSKVVFAQARLHYMFVTIASSGDLKLHHSSKLLHPHHVCRRAFYQISMAEFRVVYFESWQLLHTLVSLDYVPINILRKID